MTPATQARTAAGFQIEQFAAKLRVSPAYLRRLEKSGGFPYATAVRCARLTGAPFDLYLKRRPNN